MIKSSNLIYLTILHSTYLTFKLSIIQKSLKSSSLSWVFAIGDSVASISGCGGVSATGRSAGEIGGGCGGDAPRCTVDDGDPCLSARVDSSLTLMCPPTMSLRSDGISSAAAH